MSNVGGVGSGQPYQPKIEDPPKSASAAPDVTKSDVKKAVELGLDAWETAAHYLSPTPGQSCVPFFLRKTMLEGEGVGEATKDTVVHYLFDAKEKAESVEFFEGKPGLMEGDFPPLAQGTMGKDKTPIDTAASGAAAMKKNEAAGMSGWEAAMAAGKDCKVKG